MAPSGLENSLPMCRVSSATWTRTVSTLSPCARAGTSPIWPASPCRERWRGISTSPAPCAASCWCGRARASPVVVLNSFAEKLVALRVLMGRQDRLGLQGLCRVALHARGQCSRSISGSAASRVGFEKDGLSAAHWEEIQCALPKLQMINCSHMMDEVRWIKTAG